MSARTLTNQNMQCAAHLTPDRLRMVRVRQSSAIQDFALNGMTRGGDHFFRLANSAFIHALARCASCRSDSISDALRAVVPGKGAGFWFGAGIEPVAGCTSDDCFGGTESCTGSLFDRPGGSAAECLARRLPPPRLPSALPCCASMSAHVGRQGSWLLGCMQGGPRDWRFLQCIGSIFAGSLRVDPPHFGFCYGLPGRCLKTGNFAGNRLSENQGVEGAKRMGGAGAGER